jgi:hypothetical protein
MNLLLKFKDLKEEVVNTAHILLEENPKNKEIVFKILDYIQNDKELEYPHELDVESWEDDSITFTDGLILLNIAKQDDKYIGTIEGNWFSSPNEKPVQLPIPKITESYENQFNAIAQTIIQRGDIVNRYYLPKLNIKNNEELSKNPNFRKWKKIMFGISLCGLDFVDVHKAVKNQECILSHIAVKDVESLPNSIDFDKKVSNCLIAIKIPQSKGLDEINKIAEIFTEKLDEDCQVLWQAINHNKEDYEIIFLYN